MPAVSQSNNDNLWNKQADSTWELTTPHIALQKRLMRHQSKDNVGLSYELKHHRRVFKNSSAVSQSKVHHLSSLHQRSPALAIDDFSKLTKHPHQHQF